MPQYRENTDTNQQPSPIAVERMVALVAKGWMSFHSFSPEHFADLYHDDDDDMAMVSADGDIQIEAPDATIFIAANDAAGFKEWLSGSRHRWQWT